MFDIFYFKNCPATVPYATQIHSIEQARELCRTRYFWIVDYLCDYSEWDFLWEPAPWEKDFRHAFASQHQSDSGTYLIPKSGYKETKYNNLSINRLPCLDNWTNTEFDLDYSWHPDPTDPPYIYQIGTQWQKTGGPRYIVPGATEIKYVDEVKIKTHRVATGIIVVKHTNSVPEMNTDIPIVETSRFISNYLGTLTRVLEKIQDHEHVWVVSDLCDYTDFDFSWHPEIWQNTMLHVFPSNEQKFGDTFFVHIPSFLERARDIEVLEWFNPLNFVQEKPIIRKDPPTVEYTSDTVVDAVWEHTFTEPVVQFYRYSPEKPVTISLWQERLRTVVPLRKGSESVIVPRDAKNHIKTQIYDYQWINKKHKPVNAYPVDIVFISNGESNAEQNWEHLCKCTQNIPNRVVRVDGVKGRAEAYRAAVSASETDWAFCVFAKLEVDSDFDWSWQPDRLQAPKHYIFHAKNPVNGLTYGHMAMIAYNKQLTLNTDPIGLDFTLDSEHEVVPLLSGVARYADDPWIAWRSAFRECIKLYNSLPDINNEWRLQQWLKVNLQGDVIGDWSIRGAEDAVDYYDSVQGSFDALKLTYEWAWLEDHFTQRYNQSPDQLYTQFLNQ